MLRCNWLFVVLIVWSSMCCAEAFGHPPVQQVQYGYGGGYYTPRYDFYTPSFRYSYGYSVPYRSPYGYHRHLTFDGRVIEHGDWNYGSWYAHRGVPLPWDKYRGPLAPGSYTYGGYRYCPGGVCPW